MARERDQRLKNEREEKINASKYHKNSNIKVGDTVVLRNFDKRSKFDPLFPLELYEVITRKGTTVTVRRYKDHKIFRRHPDDLKVTSMRPATEEKASVATER